MWQRRTFLGGALALAATPVRAASEPHYPLVVELFTSQGCPLCPRANETLAELDGRGDLLALALSVDIMDSLGWRDTFAQPAFGARQNAYCKGMRVRFAYTPQMVVNGLEDVRGSRPRAVRSLLEDHREASRAPFARPESLSVDRSGDAAIVRVGASTLPRGDGAPAADVWLMGYTPGTQWVDVKSGDNAGDRVPVHNVVTDIRRLGGWTGAAADLPVDAVNGSAAVLVQEQGLGRILAAKSLAAS